MGRIATEHASSDRPLISRSEPDPPDLSGRSPRWLALAEILLVFGVLFLQGAWPVPDVNEPYYLGKAIHFWNPDWSAGDTFLNSADAHQVFYLTFGWLSLWLAPASLAWVGRILTWLLLAWAWRRLSWALVARPWFSVLTAAWFVALLARFHLAGEWVIGGVEAKGFAYVLLFLGLEALVRNRWKQTLLLLGAASAFHVLVGGWAVVAAGVAWLLQPADRPRLRSLGPALLAGFVLSLPGLLPALWLTWGVDPELASRAHEIYVFERLSHHLVPSHFPAAFVDRFLLLILVLAVLECATPADDRRRRFRNFVFGALAIAAAGAALGLLESVDGPLAARLLRFYWFRLSDVAVPMAVALLGARLIRDTLAVDRRRGRWALIAAILVATLHVGEQGWKRFHPMVPRADRLHDFPETEMRLRDYASWRTACEWIAESEIPADARFLTPRVSQTFKWYSGRGEVVNRKDVPQDAGSIVRWWEEIRDVHGIGTPPSGRQWHVSLAQGGEDRLVHLAHKYEADYAITVRWPLLRLPVVYSNEIYVIYRLPPRTPE